MANARDYCFRHARMYSGWQCPLCAEEAEEAAKRSASGHPPEPTVPADAKPANSGGAQGTGPVARAPEESAAKSEQAERQLAGGAVREALELSEQAVSLDSYNLHAHLIGARAARIMRDTARELEFLEAGVGLLRQPQYAASSAWFVEVLKHVRDRRLVGQIVETYLADGGRPAEDALPLVRAVVARDAVSDALVLLDSLPPSARSLATCAFTLQVTGHRTDPELREYLHGVSAEQRGRLLAEFIELRQDPSFQPSTLDALREALRQRYDEWAKDIGQMLGDRAKAEAARTLGSTWVAAAVSSSLTFLIVGVIVAVVLMFVIGGAVALVGGVAFALACAIGGFFYGRDTEITRLLFSRLPSIKAELAADELNEWVGALNEGVRAEGPVGVETCPFCAAQVPDETTTCPQCGHDLPTDPTEAAPPLPVTPSTDAAAGEAPADVAAGVPLTAPEAPAQPERPSVS